MTVRKQLWQGVSYTYYTLNIVYICLSEEEGCTADEGKLPADAEQCTPDGKAAADKIGLPSSEYSETSEFSEKRWQLS